MPNIRVFWNGLKIAFLIMGTTIGAGFASGRELWEFFASYGSSSSMYVVLSILLFSISCYIILTISQRIQAHNYTYVLKELVGSKLGKMYDFFILIYLLSTTVIMFAGSGAALQYWSIPYWAGVAILGVCVLLAFIKGFEGVISLNSILIPVLIMTLIAVCLMFIEAGYGEKTDVLSEQNILSSAITFTAFNILPLIAILSVVGRSLKPVEIKVASVACAIGLCAVAVLYNETLLRISSDIMFYEVPLYAILRYFSVELTLLVSFVLWLAIYTTAISGVFGIISRAEKLYLPKWLLAGGLMLLIIPMTRFGFSNLVKLLYPLYGVLNLFILAMILLYPLAKREKMR
ncbi:GerAB/ArcD/ProY family transporter [Bacillus horti]|uniref:Membrane protein YkvI n=1 Tax=Caldalkalibacillus horti TaxID=77523 RepID=A0ABT9W1K0_9BACI|nr:GerAB/ArcD/ProY family transporter [Bacillus horti]MDQ0167118.1 putative membrane protein YkvI [Bacillus horti]